MVVQEVLQQHQLQKNYLKKSLIDMRKEKKSNFERITVHEMFSTFGNEIIIFSKNKIYRFLLLISIILLSVLSIFVMYSTDISDGNFYHSFNHFVRFGVFFL